MCHAAIASARRGSRIEIDDPLARACPDGAGLSQTPQDWIMVDIEFALRHKVLTTPAEMR